MTVELAALHVADDADLWRSLGFTVTGLPAAATMAGVRVVPIGSEAGRGLVGWALRGTRANQIDGIPTGADDPAVDADDDDAGDESTAHPNGVVAIDHVVLATPDLQRTIASIEEAGADLRRVRDAGRDPRGGLRQQAFFRLGRPILEVVGPAEPSGDGPSRFYGITFTVADLDVTASFLGDRLRPVKDAVQPGRRIATLDRAAGSSVPLAFMTPEPRRR